MKTSATAIHITKVIKISHTDRKGRFTGRLYVAAM